MSRGRAAPPAGAPAAPGAPDEPGSGLRAGADATVGEAAPRAAGAADAERAGAAAGAGAVATAPEARPAHPGPRALLLRFGVAALLVVLDLLSKTAICGWLERLEREGRLVVDACGGFHRRLPLSGEWLSLMLSLNPGAAFGQFGSWPRLLVSGRIAAVLFLGWLLLRAAPGRRLHVTALVLVLAGALGNLYDNLLRVRDLALDRYYAAHPFGPVRDFIDVYFPVWSWHFPTFNVADSCITVGAALLLLAGLLPQRRGHPAAPDAPVR